MYPWGLELLYIYRDLDNDIKKQFGRKFLAVCNMFVRSHLHILRKISIVHATNRPYLWVCSLQLRHVYLICLLGGSYLWYETMCYLLNLLGMPGVRYVGVLVKDSIANT